LFPKKDFQQDVHKEKKAKEEEKNIKK